MDLPRHSKDFFVVVHIKLLSSEFISKKTWSLSTEKKDVRRKATPDKKTMPLPRIESGPALKAPAKKRKTMLKNMPHEPVMVNKMRATAEDIMDRPVPSMLLPLNTLETEHNVTWHA